MAIQNSTHKNKQASALQAAWNFYRFGQISDAEDICHEVLQSDPRQPEALHLLGTLFLHHGKAKEAVELFSLAIKLNPRNPESFSNLGLAYHEQGQLAEAIKHYKQALTLKSDYADAHYNLHAALLDPKDTDTSITLLRKVVSISPGDIDARFMLAVLLDYSGKHEESIQYLDSIPKHSKLFLARIDAWNYLKAASQQLPAVMGSGIEVFKHGLAAANPDGLVLEFGVRFGTSIRIISTMVDAIHGFDSFEGLPDEWHHEPKGSYTTKGVVPVVPANVSLHVGWFDETIPKFLAQHPGPVRFINVDCDIYSSTKTLLELLAPRMVVGSVIVFDEYIGNEHWRQDEYKAFQEAVEKHGWQYEYLCFSFFTKQVGVRITKV